MNNKMGQYVRMRRLDMGMSLREFGKLCGMSHTHIDSIEKGTDIRTGRRVNLTASSISKLASALGITDTELLNMGETVPEQASNAQLKAALFGDINASDRMLDEVKRYARYLAERGE